MKSYNRTVILDLSFENIDYAKNACLSLALIFMAEKPRNITLFW